VTAVYVVYDTASRKIRIARAGHPLPILFRPAEGKARELTCEGVFMMGLLPYENVPVTEISLYPGDRLLFYTDGITERFSVNNGVYGEERLCRMMEQSNVDSPQPLLDSILLDLADFAGARQSDDDQAMLLLMPE
jgi:phosphoserine phosphatase RsbU/P